MKAFENKFLQIRLRISYMEQKINEFVRHVTAKLQKLAWYECITKLGSLCKTMLQGTLKR
ncbi:hypothetical protein DPMN_147644 [Dreissena polymorpha]|uniref:Uncharacterized protein n=1 Tax=Dreissena polymorpha TaxID=45954 RepID=A0A9D4FAY4_DREPO|nr:hypothetical protein DPMN_147644 [Dreissena polymorpha]